MSVLALACGGDTPTSPPPPPPVTAVGISCPANVSVTASSSAATGAVATYAAPTTSGGVAPVTASCLPFSGTLFNAGSTTVNCTATDGVGAQATCPFTVTVTIPIPVLTGTKFLAFGDSITAGENGSLKSIIDFGFDYPTALQQLLVARYTSQTPTVTNRGLSGEWARGVNLGNTDMQLGQEGGTDRINSVLVFSQPEVLLLLEGVNDLVVSNTYPMPVLRDNVITALRYDIGIAKARGVKKIFLSTLTPVLVGSRDWAIHNGDLITPVNAAIRSLAIEQGVVLVDGYAALVGNAGANIAGDGLHLTRTGRALLAQAFFDAIKANFETGPSVDAIRRR